jgi:hypothetical protein
MHALNLRRLAVASCLTLVSLSTVLAAAAGPVAPAKPASPPAVLTAGEFTRAFAGALDEEGGSFATFAGARAFLASRGISLPDGLEASAPLTEGLLADIATRAGVPSAASRPERRVEASEADRFLSSVTASGSFAAGASAANSSDGQVTALGACCVSGSCTLTGPSYCAVLGGVFRGSGVTCTPDPCAAGLGTCCLGKLGPCVFTQPNECDGRFRGTQVCTRKTCSREPESPSQP